MIQIPGSIAKPARYAGIEPKRRMKDPARSAVRFALCFPDVYEVGMSYYGYFLLYELANSIDGVWCERCFAPWHDMDDHLRNSGMSLSTLESQTPLNRMDIVGFSLTYELNVTNVLNMLSLAHIPIMAEDRNTGPIIIAGGPLTLNPRPFERFFDLIVVGEADQVLKTMLETVRAMKGESRARIIEELAKLDGLYAPLLGKDRVKRLVISDLDQSFHAVDPPIPVVGSIHNRLNVEISRGCGNGCRFCLAGFGYRPYRERSPERVKAIIDEGLRNTGYEELSLLSLSSGDYSGLLGLVSYVREKYKGVSVSLPSLKIGTIGDREIETLGAIARTGLTFALEAASAGLRCRLNKGIDVEKLHNSIPMLKRWGWRRLKLYFMVGFPWETDEDLWAAREIVWPFERAGMEINLSISPFIPKPHTPFQWLPMDTEEMLKEKTLTLQRALKMKRVKVKYRDVRTSLIEGIIARGDERLTGLFRDLNAEGVKLEAWRECFRPEAYFEWFQKAGIDPQEFLGGREAEQSLPWDCVDMGYDKTFLKSELQKAESGNMTENCLEGCAGCGMGCDDGSSKFNVQSSKLERQSLTAEEPDVQDSKSNVEHRTLNVERGLKLSPGLETQGPSEAESFESDVQDLKPNVEHRTLNVERGLKFTFRYGKYGDARYIGHLDTMSILLRALRSAGLVIKTHGRYHPMPNISLSGALPLGVESTCELMEVEIEPGIPIDDERVQRINERLPRGMRVYEAVEGNLKAMSKESSYILVSREKRAMEGLRQIGERQGIFLYQWKEKGIKALWQQGLFTRSC